MDLDPLMRQTAITIEWADGEFTFDLRLGEVRNLQEKTGLGPPLILHNLQNNQYKVDDFRETILQGLIGGGKSAEEARKLVKKWVDDRPAKESLLPAQMILMSWIVGAPKGKATAPKTNETTTAPDDSTSTQYMEQVPQSEASVPET